MADLNKKNTAENFDKEFRLSGNKKRSVAGKIPSWIMILAGAAMITAVVVAKQPAIRPVVSGTKASVTSQNSLTLQGSDKIFAGSDVKADPAELEARFGSKGVGDYQGTAASFLITGNDLLYNVQLDELPVDENGKPQAESGEADSPVYWVDEKPFAVSLEPADPTDENLAVAETSSVYWIDEKPYDVSLEQVSNEEVAKMTDKELSEIVRAGDTYYRLQVAPAASSPDPEKSVSENPETEDKAAGGDQVIAKSGNGEQAAPDEDPFGTENRKEDPAASDEDPFGTENRKEEQAAIAWVNGKPYAVTVKPYEKPETGSDSSKADPGKSVIPVTVIGGLDKKTAVFQSEGKQYEIQAEEIDTEKYSVEGTTQPVVWIDETPLHVTLDPAESDSFNIVLEAVPEEEVPYLYEAHFGRSYDSNEKAAGPDADAQGTAEEPKETEEVTESGSENENWFVNVFHNIFGGDPTATPTPQVTLIAVEPTKMAKGPTATPIVVRMAPTSTPRGPVRLDEGEDYGSGGSDQKAEVPNTVVTAEPVFRSKEGEGNGPAQQTGETKGSEDSPMITVYPTSSTNRSSVSVPVTVVENTPEPARNPEQTVSEPTPEELPHTGMAESWNIPSMAALLVGLLLVILGVRRLRMTR